ncbi:hypothetical protein [Pseudoalteromonas luteoviolacea]|uniref:Uncharacterized protein n=1 Tax=Pseudoalteromonas luteoviolacea S4060-1 TaxID=1365257 RepID=A0A167JBY5_9GAMM|nr:hypothetical protein [Pseudoalteromonas luteoviolacea]KZN60884.1 hypothetical protein N478_26110 [Pseudoalteromonas luteoviolacea S4060-1]
MNFAIIICLGIVTLFTIRSSLMLLGNILRREKLKKKNVIMTFLFVFIMFSSFGLIFKNPELFQINKIDVKEERAKRERGEDYVGKD